MVVATYLKAHRTASSLRLKKGGRGCLIDRTKGGLNTKLQALTDRNGKPLHFILSAGQVSGYTSAAVLLSPFPEADFLLADRGHTADWHQRCPEKQGDFALYLRVKVTGISDQT